MADLSQLSDEQLGVYRDLVAKKQPATAPATPPPAIPPNAGIAPAPQPRGLGGKLSQWAGDAADDLRLGTGRTLPGRILQSVHATPLNEGVSPATANYMGSPALGTLRAVRGLGQTATPGQRVEGLKNIGGGILDAAQMPLSLAAPEASAQAVDKGIGMIPSAARAGRNFDTAMAAAKDVPVDANHFAQPVLRARQLNAVAGDPLSPVLRKTLKTIGPTTEPLTYENARILASSAGRKAQQAAMAPNQLTGEMGKRLGEAASGLDAATAEAAERAGVGPIHNAAMTEYRNAMRLRQGLRTAGKIAAPIALGAAGVKLGRQLGYLGN